MVVREQATVPMFFAQVFGVSSLTISVTATASAGGGPGLPADLAIIVDSTASMNSTDSNCTVPGVSHPTREDCALYAVRTLLGQLSPCAAGLSSCGTVTSSSGYAGETAYNVPNPFHEVTLFTFPGLKLVPQAALQYDCDSSTPGSSAIAPYNCLSTGTPPTNVCGPSGLPIYEIVPLSSDFRASDAATTLATSSILVKAARGGASGCQQGMTAQGGVGTFYAGIINDAQAALVANPRSNTLSTCATAIGGCAQNIMVLVSDGEANADSSNVSPKYPHANQCQQAVTAAQAATAAGTTVYAVAYGSPSSGCTTDSGTYASPCNTMAAIASGGPTSSAFFFSDYNQSGSSSTCVSASHSITGLDSIFKAISADLTLARLVPNGTP
jgi:hypothetical protein